MAKSPKADAARKSGGAKKNAAVGEARPAQSKRSKLKEIAGVKVPKDLREVAAAAQKLAENPLVRDIVTAGVMAAMAALTEAQQEAKERKALAGTGGDLDTQASNRSTAKVVAAAAAGAISKRLISEAKTRGPELLAKLEGLAEGSGKSGGSEAKTAEARQGDAERQDDGSSDTGAAASPGSGRTESGANI
jgi:hypothetical protein